MNTYEGAFLLYVFLFWEKSLSSKEEVSPVDTEAITDREQISERRMDYNGIDAQMRCMWFGIYV